MGIPDLSTSSFANPKTSALLHFYTAPDSYHFQSFSSPYTMFTNTPTSRFQSRVTNLWKLAGGIAFCVCTMLFFTSDAMHRRLGQGWVEDKNLYQAINAAFKEAMAGRFFPAGHAGNSEKSVRARQEINEELLNRQTEIPAEDREYITNTMNACTFTPEREEKTRELYRLLEYTLMCNN